MPHDDSVTLKLTVETYKPHREGVRAAAMPWWLAAAGGAVICAVAGWAIITALVLVSQLAQVEQVSGSAVNIATRLWLLANGGVFTADGVTIGLVPLGATVLIGLGLHGTASYAGKQIILSRDETPALGAGVAKITGLVGAVYGLIVTITAMIIDMGGPALRAGGGALLLGFIMAFFGSKRSLGWNPQKAWPLWTRAIPRAVSAGVLVAFFAGVVSLTASLIVHRDQFIMMTEQLHAGRVGTVVLCLAQLAYVVNIIVWCATWTMGAGFTLGDGSVVSMAGTHVGMLPAIPVTSIIPSAEASWWNLLWLLGPVLAGATAAFAILRARPRARFDETALVGGLSGVLAGACFTALATFTRGGIGVDRLAFLGPHLPLLLVFSCSIMGLSGALTGLIAGLARGSNVEPDPRWWSRWLQDKPDVPALYEPTTSPSWIVSTKTVAENVPPDGEESGAADGGQLSSTAGASVGESPANRTPRFLAKFLHRGQSPQQDTSEAAVTEDEPPISGDDAASDVPQQADETDDTHTEQYTVEPQATRQDEPAHDEQPPFDFYAGS